MQFLTTIVSIPVVLVITTRYFIPLYREKVKLSAYAYLEQRFGLFARFYGNFAFVVFHFFKMSMVLYLLCLAISGVTGLHILLLIGFVGAVTLVYTFVGGIEGVIWTEVIQGILLLGGGIVVLLFLLFHSGGGPGEIVSRAYVAGKLKLATFNFDWSQLSVWVLICFGFNLYLHTYVTNQAFVQRYLLAPSTKEAGDAIWLSFYMLVVVWVVFMTVGACCGRSTKSIAGCSRKPFVQSRTRCSRTTLAGSCQWESKA